MYRRSSVLFQGIVVLMIAVLLCVTASSGQVETRQSTTDNTEKVHSQIFHGNEVPSIPEHLSKTTGDITVTSDADQDDLMVTDLYPPPYPPQNLVSLSCVADAVVIASPEKGISHMTADHLFVYSEWTMQIQTVLQDTAKAPIGDGDTILVVRPGGKIEIAGRAVTGVAFDFPEFRPDNKYLLFLTYIPQTGAFKVKPRRAFNLSIDPRKPDTSYQYKRGETVTPDQWLYENADSASPDELVINARAAIAYAAGMTTCKKTGEE